MNRPPAPRRVVLVHGLYFTGHELVLLARRLRHAGYTTERFAYGSVREPAERVTARLAACLASRPAHLVGHSLGGLVIHRLAHRHPQLCRGRAVALGTPFRGSAAARWIEGHGLGRWLLGHAREWGLVEGVHAWRAPMPIGVIAGCLGLGLGRLLPGLARPNDGTVAVAETRLAGASDHRVLPVSHFGLLLSAAVAHAAVTFLATGRFAAPADADRIALRSVSQVRNSMAGHSKWANIRFRKERQDARRGKLFTKLLREVTVATRMGGPDPAANPRLRAAIDAALDANVPKDNIERAVARGSGEGGAENVEEVRYEGYGPGGVAVLVECMTDNRNRTVAEVRHAFSKAGGSLGQDGSVAYLFSRQGVITFPPGTDEDAVMEVAIEAGAEDVVVNDDGSIDVLTGYEDFGAVKDALVAAGLEPAASELTMRAATEVEVAADDVERLARLLDTLEDLDDVQRVYSNAAFPDQAVEQA